jgi:hypothetical protein
MPFSNEDKFVIKILREEKRYSSRKLLKEFPNKKWSRRGLDYLLKKIDNRGTAARLAGSGRPRSVRTSDNIDGVAELVLSQEDKPQTHRSVRQISNELTMTRSSVHRIIKTDLKLKCLKKKRAQELTEANKSARLDRAKLLLKKYPSHLVDFIWFSDEKLFTIAAPSNTQNDRLYVHSDVKKKNVSGARLLRTRSTFSKSVMVTVAVSVLGCTSIHFLEPGVKINGQYYRDTVLKTMLLPEIRGVSGDFFVFQQDSAPAHRARDTVELLKTETPDFIQPDLWPPNSPDLNPVDYSVWGILQERVYRTRVTSLEELKQRLTAEWATLDHNIIAAAIRQWRRRLTACVKAEGGHFEQCL